MEDESGFTVGRLVRTLMAYERFPRSTQEAVVFESRSGSVDGDIWLAPSLDAARRLRMGEDRFERSQFTADVLELRFHFAERATEAVVEDTARALKRFLRTEKKELRLHRVEFLRHKSYVEGPARHWLGFIRRWKKTAVET